MSDNPFTRAISRTNRRPQTPAPKPQPKGKVIKQSTTKIEYRNPMSELGEKYLGACNHPFTKSQYEKLVKSPKLPPTFLSIRASLPKNGEVCLYASSVFGGAVLKGLIGKLKTSCTAAAGKGSKAACTELVADLSARVKGAPKVETHKLPDQYDVDVINPLKSKFWIHLAIATIGGFGFAAGLGIWGKMTGKSIIQQLKDLFNNKNGDGDGTGKTGGDSADTSTSSAADTGSKMVAGALGVAAVLLDKLDDIEFPPIVPAMDTIDQNYILDPTSAAQAAYNGMTVAEWSAVHTYSSAGIAEGLKKVAVGIGLFVGAVIITIFGPKMMPKGMMQPQPSPAGFGGGGFMPGGQGCSPISGCTPGVT